MSIYGSFVRLVASVRVVGQLLNKRSRASRRRRRHVVHLAQIEQLEGRALLAAYLVSNTNDVGSGSLRAAMILANSQAGADTIRFDANLTGQTIALSSELPYITESLEIRGPANSTSAITIYGDSLSGSRPFTILNSAAIVTLANLTITGGTIANTSGGGGLYTNGPDVRLNNVRITGNRAGNGGGVYNDSLGRLSLNNVEISNNQAADSGGGLYNTGLVVVKGSQIVGNSAGSKGGGIAAKSGIVSVLDSTVSANSAVGQGGGFFSDANSVLIGAQLLASNNHAGSGGGHFDAVAAIATYTNSTFVGNSAAGLVGGLHSQGALTLVNCTVVNNSAFSSSPQSTGGVYGDGTQSTLNIVNTVIALNMAPFPGFRDIDRSKVDFESGNFIGTVSGDPRLGPLQDNGGPTLTKMPYSNSPLIDAGDSARATTNGQLGGSTLLTVDQRGFKRFIGKNSNPAKTVDVGAVEYNPGADVPIVTGADAGQPPRITMYNRDGSVRWSRLAFPASFTGGVRVAVGDVNGDGVEDVIAGQGPGGQSLYRTFNGVTGTLLVSFAPFGTSYTGGINVASADFNNDGRDDILVGTGGGTVSRVQVRNAANSSQTLRNFRVGLTTDTAEVRVAVGDVNKDGIPDIMATLGPKVKVFNGAVNTFTPTKLHEFTPFGTTYTGIIYVAAGMLNTDGKADIIVSGGTGASSQIILYAGGTGTTGGQPTLLQRILTRDSTSTTGNRIAARDIDGDGISEIVTTAGPGADPITRVFWSKKNYSTFYAFNDAFLQNTLGMFVATG